MTCSLVDKAFRGRGAFSMPLDAANDAITHPGGGTVTSYPDDAKGRKVSASFLCKGWLSMFERQGFELVRGLDKNHWIAARCVRARTSRGLSLRSG